MSISKEKNDDSSHFSSETNINFREEAKDSTKDLPKSYIIKSKKKKVKFKSKFIKVINVESYKKYYGDNQPTNRQNFHIPRYKEIHCTCNIF